VVSGPELKRSKGYLRADGFSGEFLTVGVAGWRGNEGVEAKSHLYKYNIPNRRGLFAFALVMRRRILSSPHTRTHMYGSRAGKNFATDHDDVPNRLDIYRVNDMDSGRGDRRT